MGATADIRRGRLRRGLDALYDGAALLAAGALLALLGIIVAQMVARWSGLMLRGGAEYAGYLMAAASFLAFAHTLNRGVHIRVELALSAIGRARPAAEVLGLVIGTAISAYLAFYSCRMVFWSRKLGDISQGQDMMPLWIVQLPVAIGAVLLAVAFADNLLTRLRTGRDNIATESPDLGRDK